MTARRLGPGDADLWQALWRAALHEAPGAFATARDPAPMAMRVASARPFVWEEGGRAVASALWCRDGDPDRPTRAWVEALYVLPEARGRGVAGRLLDALATDAAACGVAELWLAVAPENAAARRAYARAGFRPVPDTNALRDTVALMRRLEPPAHAG